MRSVAGALLFGALLDSVLASGPSKSKSAQVAVSSNYSSSAWQYGAFAEDRPKDCPPCFNCLLPSFNCAQFGTCRNYDGKCECPPGYGGEGCLEPLCGSLADGKNRLPREGDDPCKCKDGWGGINCNVCENDRACGSMMGEGLEGEGVCYTAGLTVKESFQICDVTNRKIKDQLKNDGIPQATFSCERGNNTCSFQFWVAEVESFYCALDTCKFSGTSTYEKNSTQAICENMKCECIADRFLCGKDGSVDIGEFLTEDIKGPASFTCDDTSNGDCVFSEEAMNGLISSVFGDPAIFINCASGECLHYTEIPGYQRPSKQINSAAIAGAIAGSALFIVAVALGIAYASRRSAQKMGRGPIHLPEEDEVEMRVDHKPAILMFKDIGYTINGKQILQGVQGAARPGQVMAIMGASGAGKTTFLDIIARKNKRGIVTGNVYVNGATVTDDEFRSVIGFVDQEDTLMATLTVYETILNSALLRLPRDMPWHAKNKRVVDVMQQLGIFHIRDSMIGSEEGFRGISGGEKRRVSIACELVTSPSILFLDEPTSGLDAYNAYNVIECLVTLAKSYSRTVVFTIHQPRSNIVALFDRLVLLAHGHTVYSGAYNDLQDYFKEQGYECPPGFNIADYVVDLTMHAEQTTSQPVSSTNSAAPPSKRPGVRRRDSVRARQERILFTRRQTSDEHEHNLPPPAEGQEEQTDLDKLISAYIGSDLAKALSSEIQDSINTNTNSGDLIPNGAEASNSNGNGFTAREKTEGFKRLGLVGQFRILAWRTWTNLHRNPLLLLTHYAIAIVLSVFCGFLFYGLTFDIPGFQNRMGLFFFVLALFGFSTLTTLNVFAAERLLFMKERANGYYAPITYFTTKVLFDIVPLRVLPPIIMGCIIYPMVGLVSEWSIFFKFILVLVLFNLSAAGICFFIGIVIRDTNVANLIGSLVMLFSLLMCGLLLNSESIPKAVLWLQKISIFHYGFEALLVNEVKYLTLVQRKYGLDIEVPGATILSSFGFDSQALWWDVLGLGVFACVFIILSYAALHILLKEKR